LVKNSRRHFNKPSATVQSVITRGVVDLFFISYCIFLALKRNHVSKENEHFLLTRLDHFIFTVLILFLILFPPDFYGNVNSFNSY